MRTHRGRENLATYLNDHLAGAAAGIGLARHLETLDPETRVANFLAVLRAEIEADREELIRLMDHLGVPRSRMRRTTAWLAAKVTETKLRLDDTARGPLYWLESLEAIGVGIDGKVALWRALNTAAMSNPALDGILDYRRLEKRAHEQREALEHVRLEAARAAFEDGSRTESSAVPQLPPRTGIPGHI